MSEQRVTDQKLATVAKGAMPGGMLHLVACDLIDARATIARLTAEIAGLRGPVKAGLWCGPWWRDGARLCMCYDGEMSRERTAARSYPSGWTVFEDGHDGAIVASGPETGPAAEALCVAALRAAGVEVRE